MYCLWWPLVRCSSLTVYQSQQTHVYKAYVYTTSRFSAPHIQYNYTAILSIFFPLEYQTGSRLIRDREHDLAKEGSKNISKEKFEEVCKNVPMCNLWKCNVPCVLKKKDLRQAGGFLTLRGNLRWFLRTFFSEIQIILMFCLTTKCSKYFQEMFLAI